jgi:hypothetical protein
MTTLVAQIAPQRNTQYTALASALAPYELQVSPLGPDMADIQPLRLGGQDYLKFCCTASSRPTMAGWPMVKRRWLRQD